MTTENDPKLLKIACVTTGSNLRRLAGMDLSSMADQKVRIINSLVSVILHSSHVSIQDSNHTNALSTRCYPSRTKEYFIYCPYESCEFQAPEKPSCCMLSQSVNIVY